MADKKGKVLCVDDEPHVLRALQWLLQKEFDIHIAGSAQEAIRLLGQHDFDVIVSDQRMPGVTGVELLREVRKRAPRAMRILLTGYSDLDAMVRSVNESEVFRFITKPWDIRELPKLIAEAAHIARTEPAVPVEGEPLPVNVIALSPAEVTAAATAAPLHQVTTVAMHPNENILVLDDSPEVHEAVTQIVGNTVQVQHAYNIADAVRMLNEKPVGVIVSEVRVGNIDATRLVRLMKARHPETVSVVFSDQRDAQLVMTLINQGQVYRFIPKPFKTGFIRLVLDAALKRHRLLMDSPAMRKRFAVEAAAAEVSDTLLQDVQRAAAAVKSNGGTAPSKPGAPAPRAVAAMAGRAASLADPSLGGKLAAGFRRLFG